MNVRFVYVGADHKGMIAFGEPPGKFYAQPVGFLRGDFPRAEGLADMVGDHIWIYRCAESACPVFWKSPVRKEGITVPDKIMNAAETPS